MHTTPNSKQAPTHAHNTQLTARWLVTPQGVALEKQAASTPQVQHSSGAFPSQILGHPGTAVLTLLLLPFLLELVDNGHELLELSHLGGQGLPHLLLVLQQGRLG